MARRKTTPKLTRRQRRLLQLRRRAIWIAGMAVVAATLVLADRRGVFGYAPIGDFRKYNARTFRVSRVVDGDTLDVDVPDPRSGRKTTRIRLWGVDTPETVKPNTLPQPFGPEASAFAKRLCEGKRVRLALDPETTRGRYGRLLAYVFLPDGRMLNRVLVTEGHGYADPRFPHAYYGEFMRLQVRAKRNGRGLWKTVRDSDLPYYWHGKLKLPER